LGKELFGTDGIRGVAGEYPLDPQTVFAFGEALASDIKANAREGAVLIGADTRESSDWIAAMVAGGLAKLGVAARYAGVITTPGVAYLTRSGPFAAGVMISASHNPYQDNGIKVFSHSGFKLPDEEEHTIEQELLRLRSAGGEPAPSELKIEDELDREYLAWLRGTVAGRFEGKKIALDCGNGAASRLGPELIAGLGAEVVTVCAQPDGRNINLNCGALHPEHVARAVVEHGADYGVAFDGDADRAMFASRSGRVINGDGVLLAAARGWKASGRLRGGTVVSTVMANLGLERVLESDGVAMVRTPVGDKYVLEEMVRRDAVIGGEQSGHIIFREYATTGDGLLTALKVFELARDAGAGLDELTADLKVYPQKLVNIRVREKKGLLEHPAVAREIKRAEESFGGSGRVVVRFSGTEPLARVMVEGADAGKVDTFSASIAEVIRQELGA
jgi:phosphoglucosamine mutase